MPESRPSAVSAFTWPSSSNRWRISRPILSSTSARSPPVARWMITAITKNRTSMTGIRSAMLRRDSSIGMPRFCSSKTRLNSSAIGPFISSATRCRPEARPCPARRARLISSTASGMAATNLRIRCLLPLEQPEERHRRQEGRAQRDRRRSAAGTRPRRPAPTAASPPTMAMKRVEGQVDVGLLVEQVEVLGVGDQPGPERRSAQVDRRRAEPGCRRPGRFLASWPLCPVSPASRSSASLAERAGHHQAQPADDDQDDHADRRSDIEHRIVALLIAVWHRSGFPA